VPARREERHEAARAVQHGQLDINLTRLTQLGTVDTTVAAFLAAAVRSRCNIIIGGVNAEADTVRAPHPREQVRSAPTSCGLLNRS
jgi:hypothetical protein